MKKRRTIKRNDRTYQGTPDEIADLIVRAAVRLFMKQREQQYRGRRHE